MDQKGGQKKKGISQDLLLDDFFKPPVEEEPVKKDVSKEVKKQEAPGEKKGEKATLKKDLLLDDFFTPPVEETKEVPSREEKKEPVKVREEEKPPAQESVSTTYKQVKKVVSPPKVERTPEPVKPPPAPEPPHMTPPPQRSLKELLEEPLFEQKKEEPVISTPSRTPQPAVTPKPVVITPVPGKGARKIPVIPIIGGVLLVVILGVAGYFVFGKRESRSPEVKESGQVVKVEKPKQELETSQPSPSEIPEQKVGISPPLTTEATNQVVTPPGEPEAKVEIPSGAPSPTVKPEETKPQETVMEVVATPPKKQEEKPVAKINKYIVTAGPFSTKEEAKAQEVKIKVLGYTPKLTTGTQTVEIYNLFVDPPVPEAEANVIRLKMSLKGFSAELVDAGENKRVKIGEYKSLSEAIDKKNMASELGYTITLEITRSSEKVYNLEMGFPESSSAQQAIEKLKGFGIEAVMSEKKG